jgi:PKD repeat protein
MKNLTSIIGVLSLVLFSSVNVNAQCGATDVTADPQPEMICEGNSTIITFTPSGACAGNYEYEVLAGATVVQAWSTTSTFNAAPLTTTVYTVNLRCNGCPAIVVWANFTVEGIEEPTVNGILSICPGEFTTLTASASTGNLSWWNAANGGAQLSPTDVYTTPALSTDATIAPAGPYCALDLPVNLSAVDAGGIWSGTGITNVVSGTFNPATAGAGLNTITYEIAGGCGDLQTYDILVHATPIVNFVADNIVGCAPVDVTFTNLSTPLGSSNVWSFGNLDSSWMTTGPTTTYNTPDCFDVTLTVTQNGCTNSLTIQSLVCVQDVPDAGFLVNSVGADIFDPEFIFSNTSTNADTYFWDFGDDESSSLEDPIHMYPQVASGYDVCLIASNSIDESCADNLYSCNC